MICSCCGHEKAATDFTKLNISKDGTRGLCRECKRIRDKAHREKKDRQDSSLTYFELKPDLVSRKSRPRIGVLLLDKITNHRRAPVTQKGLNIGLQAVLSELDEPYEYCTVENINHYEYTLCSLSSILDIEDLIYTFEKYGPEQVRSTVIVGGFGCVNVKMIRQYIDVAVFGRAEGQINGILKRFDFPNVWRKAKDPHIENMYQLRQPVHLVDGEESVGCRNKCLFCQYGWTRRAINEGELYNPGSHFNAKETDWHGLMVDQAGRYTTAWDGVTEETRFRVNKRITDQDIVDKFKEIDSVGVDGTVMIKVFQIVGYPWETKQDVIKGFNHQLRMLEQIDREIYTSINIAFLFTPFGPEPLTPMQYEPANLGINWRDVLSGKGYQGNNIKAYVIPSIQGPFSLMKRVFINRASPEDIESFKSIVYDRKLKRIPERYKVPFLLKHNYIQPEMFGRVSAAEFDYLQLPVSTGVNKYATHA